MDNKEVPCQKREGTSFLFQLPNETTDEENIYNPFVGIAALGCVSLLAGARHCA
jgi:hypothetical protein